MRWLAVFVVIALAGCPSKKPKYPSCDGDKDCKKGEKCVNKKCQKPECSVDKDCGAGKTCEDGSCQDIPGWCGDDGDCPNGQICQDHACSACATDDQCGEEGHCREGKCLRKGQCDTDDDCPEELDCVNGVCTADHSGGGGNNLPSCTLTPIFFGFDQYTLDDAAKATLKTDVDCLSSAPNGVGVVGYTDPRGTTEYNIGLSDNRAQAVMTYLERLGIDPSRLRKVPKGSSEATGTDETGWAKDRRVEMVWE